jgi:mono/diheme cytochrome c family protein
MRRRPFSSWSAGQRALGLTAAVAIAVGVPAAALAVSSPKIVGNAKAGKATFASTCGVCHTLRAASSVGKVGPNLDKAKLTEAVIIRAITNGGASVMTKAAAARYATHMPPYKGVLTPTGIENVAAFVYGATRG